jgi:hypothetical protein
MDEVKSRIAIEYIFDVEKRDTVIANANHEGFSPGKRTKPFAPELLMQMKPAGVSLWCAARKT